MKFICMTRRLSFGFEVDKFVHAVAFFARRCPELSKLKLAKLLYFADKQHLVEDGRPITGDRYTKMESGPVPTAGYNILKQDDRVSAEHQSLFDHYLTIQGNNVVMKAEPNLGCLSESDLEVLNDIVEHFGEFAVARLAALRHREPAWKSAAMNGEMDFRLFFAGIADAEPIEQLVQEDQEVRDCVDEMIFEQQRYGT